MSNNCSVALLSHSVDFLLARGSNVPHPARALAIKLSHSIQQFPKYQIVNFMSRDIYHDPASIKPIACVIGRFSTGIEFSANIS